MKKSLEILQKINIAKETMAQLQGDGKTNEAFAKITEIENLQKEYEVQLKLEEMEEAQARTSGRDPEGVEIVNLGAEEGKKEDKEAQNKLHLVAFAKAIAKKPLSAEESKALSSNTDEDGGYLIPKDLSTRINTLLRENESLRKLVTVVTVTTKEGSRVIEKDADITGFTDIEELTDLPNLNSPQWGKIDYKIRDLGGLLPIPNSLLEDETGELLDYLANWFVKKAYATDNNMILFSDGSKGSQGIIGTALEDNSSKNVFKKVVLTTLISFAKLKGYFNKGFKTPIAKRLKLVTNQDGLDILDNMVDGNGRPYLTGDGTEAFPYKFKGREVLVYDNDTIPNDLTDPAKPLCPFILGDLKAGIVLFDRKKMSVNSSKEAGFINNSTIMRGIVRQDTRIWDKTAVMVIYSPLQ